MPAYTTDTRPPEGRRQLVITGVLVVLAVALAYLPSHHQQLIASTLRGTVLKPFVLTQESVAEVRVQATSSEELRTRLDSMIAVLATHYTLSEENRRLRELLELRERTGSGYLPSSVVRSGTAGSESMFHLEVGYEEGVRENAPVLTRSGLLGVVREVRSHSAIAMDWTHPEFRASAMTADGSIYGIAETRRGEFREQDRLLFNGTPFHARLEEGTPVVTSGLGGVFPRGVPIGTVEELAEAEGGWRKAYWLRPATHPGGATHVLVAVESSADSRHDLSSVWPADSILHERHVRPRLGREARRDAVFDSLTLPDTSVATGEFRARGAELFRTDSAGVRLVVRFDTAGTAGPGEEGGGATPGTREGTPPSPTPQQARPQPPAPAREQQPEAAAPSPDTAEEAGAEQGPVIRNLEAVIDSVAPDTAAGAQPDTGRAPPDTTSEPPDTNRVAPPASLPWSGGAGPRGGGDALRPGSSGAEGGWGAGSAALHRRRLRHGPAPEAR